MDSQCSGKGKSPVGKKGVNKSAGGKASREHMGEGPAPDRNNKQRVGNGRGPGGAAQPSNSGGKRGMGAPQGSRSTEPGGRTQANPKPQIRIKNPRLP